MTSQRWTLGGAAAALAMALTPPAAAQELDPPPGAASEPAAPAEAAPPSPALAEAPNWNEPEFETRGPASGDASLVADTGLSDDAETEERSKSLGESSGLMGSTGLMRVLSAASGAPGTFRLSLLTGFYSGTGFLCPQCPNPDTGEGTDSPDEVDRVSANLFLSATPLPFLEAYLGIFSHSTSTNRPVPQLKQVVGDWTLGVKAFMPAKEGQIFTIGGGLDFGFSTGSGQVGLSGIDSVNIGMHALATADFSKRTQGPVPLRMHANLNYLFDNSANLVADFESTQGSIDRIERFSLDINRVDAIQIALGAEGMFDTARPFLEWSVDIPVNRQSYLCLRNDVQPGESCLRDNPQFSFTPSRLSAGVRVMPWSVVPWWLEGMTLTGALDLATGGASDFLVEVAPEVPWSVWFGLSYAVDTRPKVKVRQVAAPVPSAPPGRLVHGLVVEKETTNAIPDALIRFDGRDLTGLISTAEGRFVTGSLEPGRYTFKITAAGYKEGLCSVDVGAAPLPTKEAPPAPSASGPAGGRGLAAEPGSVEAPPGVTSITCELEPVAKVSNLNGRVNDATTGDAIGTAKVRITDVLGRELELQVDEVGAFRFENVPPGTTLLTVQADGYLKSVTRLEVEPLQELDQRFVLAPVPAKSPIKVNGKRLEIGAPLVFADSSAKLSRDALFTIQELALFLEKNPDLGRIEIQSHTADNSLPATTLSADRANAVRDALVLHGVPSARLSARGYGGSEPVKPGDGDENRRANERVVFVLEPAALVP